MQGFDTIQVLQGSELFRNLDPGGLRCHGQN